MGLDSVMNFNFSSFYSLDDLSKCSYFRSIVFHFMWMRCALDSESYVNIVLIEVVLVGEIIKVIHVIVLEDVYVDSVQHFHYSDCN